jgi:hypothetical protein
MFDASFKLACRRAELPTPDTFPPFSLPVLPAKEDSPLGLYRTTYRVITTKSFDGIFPLSDFFPA